MARHARTRYGIFVHDPDGDSGYGKIVGAFLDPEAADEKADAIRRKSARLGFGDIECIVVPMEGGQTSASDIVFDVMAR